MKLIMSQQLIKNKGGILSSMVVEVRSPQTVRVGKHSPAPALTLDSAVKRLENVCEEIGIPLKLTLDSTQDHWQTYHWLRDELGLKKKMARIPPKERPVTHVGVVDTHNDADFLGDHMDHENWISHMVHDFSRDNMIPVQVGLLTPYRQPKELECWFDEGIWHSPDDWPEKWRGLISLDVDYTVGYGGKMWVEGKKEEGIRGSMRLLVEGWVKKKAAIEGLHVDRGSTGIKEAVIAIDALSGAMEKHKRELARARAECD